MARWKESQLVKKARQAEDSRASKVSTNTGRQRGVTIEGFIYKKVNVKGKMKVVAVKEIHYINSNQKELIKYWKDFFAQQKKRYEQSGTKP